jgi:hypothetical protein
MFDQLILLARGKMVYSGEVSKCHDYFTSIGHPCPAGYNIADFLSECLAFVPSFCITHAHNLLVDLTMQVSADSSPRHAGTGVGSDMSEDAITSFADEERALGSSSSGFNVHSPSTHTPNNTREESTELRTRPNSINESSSVPSNEGKGAALTAGNYIKRKTSQLLDVFSSSSTQADVPLNPQLAHLVQAYASSQIAADIRADIAEATSNLVEPNPDPAREQRDVVEESVGVRGRRRASYATQFKILSGRAFKNLYRNPALLTAHYISSLAIACECRLFRIFSMKWC